MKKIIKCFGYLILFLAAAFVFAGCSSKKELDLSSSQQEYIENVTNFAVVSEVSSKYGIVPGLTIDKMTAYDASYNDYYRIEFSTSGSYTVADDAGNLYTGTFKVNGYSESHGSGFDSCEITEPRNGITALPEQIIETVETRPETTVETTVLVLQSEKMIKLSEDYEKDGYTIMIGDPSSDFENDYGALECFKAFNDQVFYEVYLYDSNDAALNAEYMMFGEGDDRTPSDGAVTKIIEETVLVVEHAR